jgi:hypothetical protein
MRRGAPLVWLAIALLLAGCGREQRKDGPGAAPAADAPAAGGLRMNNDAREETFRNAGFQVCWPSGCGRVKTLEPHIIDPDQTQEFLYTCDERSHSGQGCAVYVLRAGSAEAGPPPGPDQVVSKIEDVLKRYGVRVARQRPLKAPGLEGVEVQATQPSGPGEYWARGLLSGPNIFVISAWDMQGGAFQDQELGDFFASFRVIQ